MTELRLHRGGSSRRAVWHLACCDLTVVLDRVAWDPAENGWRILARSQAAAGWLVRHHMTDACFATRAQALRTIAAILESDPLPAPAAVAFRKVSPGRYALLDGAFFAVRDGRGELWRVLRPDGTRIGRAPTLRLAALNATIFDNLLSP